MSVIPGLLPLMTFVFMIVAIIFVIGKLNKRFTAKRGYWMLFGYFLLLACSVVIYYFLSPSEENETLPEQKDTNHFDLYNVLHEGAPIASFQQYLEKTWEFPYEEDTLYIDYLGDGMDMVNIAVERYDGNTIQADFYQTPIYFNGENMIEYMNPIDVQLYSDQLVIELLEPMELEFSSYTKDFPMRQFSEGNDEWWSDFNVEWGAELLYLRIPNGIETSSNYDINIEYLNVSE